MGVVWPLKWIAALQALSAAQVATGLDAAWLPGHATRGHPTPGDPREQVDPKSKVDPNVFDMVCPGEPQRTAFLRNVTLHLGSGHIDQTQMRCFCFRKMGRDGFHLVPTSIQYQSGGFLRGIS